MSIESIYGDCLTELKKLPPNSIDAVITDPPYCSGGFTESQRMKATSQGISANRLADMAWFENDNMTTAGLIWLLREVILECVRVMKPNGHILIFTDWRMLHNLAPAIESTGVQYRNLVVWDKLYAGMGNGFKPTHELIMHFVKGKAQFFTLNGSNVIRAARVQSNKKEHHTQKPLELLKSLIDVTTREGDTVLDPFFGSGSTGEACLKMGRNCIGIEKNATHYNTAKSRLQRVAEEVNAGLFTKV